MNSKPVVWMNDEFIPWENAQVPILSHGLSRGSAIFEVFGTHTRDGQTFGFRMDAHLRRLERTADLLGMELKFSSEEIAAAVAGLVDRNKCGRGIVKIVAFWGEEAVINLILESKLDVAVFTIPASEELGLDKDAAISACFSQWRKLHPETVPVQAKACANYLNSYLIKKDAITRGYDLGLTLGTDGFLAEGAIESVFMVKDGILKTPPLGRILASITRDSIVRVAQDNGLIVREIPLQKQDVYEADEMFTCHTGIKVLPIRQFEDRDLKAPGPVTEKICRLMENVMALGDPRYADWFQKLS
ncbi:aminotransferase class IV [Desulfospira joergensenii]|uniref:aminotransferase class IV n=1 Tax=Desulfospira joergensenii TaxID=53329 RepID=UPI0003B76A78|nr:aminotransferase class IV [Desulfospira joergensenii]